MIAQGFKVYKENVLMCGDHPGEVLKLDIK